MRVSGRQVRPEWPEIRGDDRVGERSCEAARYAIAAGVPARQAKLVCAKPTTLIRRETYLPGWSATADGHDTPVRSDARIFQAVTVPAGAHTVSFSYQPPNVGWGWIALVAGLGWLLLAPATRRLQIRNTRSPS
jgi:hypothetical protein